MRVQRAVEAGLAPLKTKVRAYFGNYLYHVDDLPFSIPQMPTVFTSFRCGSGLRLLRCVLWV